MCSALQKSSSTTNTTVDTRKRGPKTPGPTRKPAHRGRSRPSAAAEGSRRRPAAAAVPADNGRTSSSQRWFSCGRHGGLRVSGAGTRSLRPGPGGLPAGSGPPRAGAPWAVEPGRAFAERRSDSARFGARSVPKGPETDRLGRQTEGPSIRFDFGGRAAPRPEAPTVRTNRRAPGRRDNMRSSNTTRLNTAGQRGGRAGPGPRSPAHQHSGRGCDGALAPSGSYGRAEA
jgi:hypothetical protein